MRIPFSSLRFQEKDGEVIMGLTVQRKIVRKVERVVFPAVPPKTDWAFLRPSLAQKIERRFQGVETPHKVKMATAGCPRNCSEAYVKDVGLVAIGEGKWEIYIGGGAGSTIRKGDLFCTVISHAEALKYASRFMQYYREHAKFMERTYGFVERIGIDVLRGILVDDSLGICTQLEERMQEAVDAYEDPWKEAQMPAYPFQFKGSKSIKDLKRSNN